MTTSTPSDFAWGLFAALGIMLRAGFSLWTDLSFYSKNGWDFSQDSGESAFYGFRGPMNDQTRMPNRERVKFSSGLMVFATAFAIYCGLKIFGF